MNQSQPSVLEHPFIRSPHRTLAGMSFPVLLSLIAEPMTGLVDTAFVSRLGSAPLAALGIGAMVLSGIFWIFNFLGIGTQTGIAQAYGNRDYERGRQTAWTAVIAGAILGLGVAAVCTPLVSAISHAMGATPNVHTAAVEYLHIRLLGAPAVLVSVAAFGALRGLMDMKTPFYIAVFVNGVNIVLDAVLIFGFGNLPPMGVAGAALAATISQYMGAVWAGAAVYRRFGFFMRLPMKDLARLFLVGRDLFIRTGLIIFFLLLSTRSATKMGPEAGAAHQAIRQVWVFTALFLDAFAITGQSLIGYFFGPGEVGTARNAAKVICLWSIGTGLLLTAAMVAGLGIVRSVLVPPDAFYAFGPAWLVAAATQPVNAVAFATDGIHWGAGDWRYLRNVVCLATGFGAAGIFFVEHSIDPSLIDVWIVIAFWLVIRAFFGIARIWPGSGTAPLKNRKR
ncbi:MAG: MATE family efflux transporter [Desulfobacterales bacterium]